MDTCGNTSGVNENDFSNEINIYPNPTSGVFTLDAGRLTTDAQITIYNVFGEKVYEMTDDRRLTTNVQTSVISHRSSVIDLSSRPKGIYFIKATSGEKIYTEKVVVQ